MADIIRLIAGSTATANVAGLILIVGLLAWIILLQFRNQKDVQTVSTNHLSGLPEMEDNVKKLVLLAEQQQIMLQSINNTLIYLRGRLNGSE